jgi:hypothetical protein
VEGRELERDGQNLNGTTLDISYRAHPLVASWEKAKRLFEASLCAVLPELAPSQRWVIALLGPLHDP